MSYKHSQKGFTLIELIAVIVILGILAATAVPKFVDMQGAAGQAAVDGVAGNLASGSALNLAAYQALNAGIQGAPTPETVTGCDNQDLILEGGLPSTEYTLGAPSAGTAPSGAGGSGTCGLTFDPGNDGTGDTYTADFPAYTTAAVPTP